MWTGRPGGVDWLKDGNRIGKEVNGKKKKNDWKLTPRFLQIRSGPVPSAQMNYRGPSPGSLLSFNINDGYADGILRGYKLGLLGQTDFANLSQCDVIDGTNF